MRMKEADRRNIWKKHKQKGKGRKDAGHGLINMDIV
jgi:hypothetical protein